MNTTRFDVLVLGDYFFDIIYSGLSEFPALGREVVSKDMVTTGGAMFITAAALRRLGIQVCWPAQFGTDPYSQHVRELAREEGIDLSYARYFDVPYRRVTSSLPLAGERAFATFMDQEPSDLYDFWLDVVRRANFTHLHIGGLHYPEQIAPVLHAAREKHATISMDCSDTPHLTQVIDWPGLLSMIDVFMPNAREARLISGLDSIPDTLSMLKRHVKIVVIKDGDCGSWASAAAQTVHVPCIAAGDVVDTTGAGDCFNAGFLFGFVGEKATLEDCLRYGNICGGLSVTGIGGATRAPNLEELRQWIAVAPVGEAVEM